MGLSIVEYGPQHKLHFNKLNRFWIEKYFRMEELDEFVLTNPEEAIIRPGGAVLMAEYDQTIAGTVALRKLGKKTFEFTKMAVDPAFRRRGIAEALSYASFYKAKELGASQVILYSNSILTGAIALYEKLGFKHEAVGLAEYERSDVKMSIDIDTALSGANEFQSRKV
ncbi:MAG: GNAT family N-acetyltransferase [Ginsengibacter sp.]